MIGKWKAALAGLVIVAAALAVTPSVASASVECGTQVASMVSTTGSDVIAIYDGSGAHFGAELWAMVDPTSHVYCGSEQARVWMQIPTSAPHWGLINFELKNCQSGQTLKSVHNDNVKTYDTSNWCTIPTSFAGVFGWFSDAQLPPDFTGTWP